MPMGTNFNLDIQNMRLPEMPGMQSGVATEPMPQIRPTAFAPITPLNTLQERSLPFLPEEQDEPKRLDLKTGKDGKIDWVATLISAGALAAGAITGNTRLAAAGSGFLQGQQQGREQRALAQERQLVRDEAKAERDFSRQEKIDRDKQREILTVEDLVAKGDFKVARSALSRVDDPTERERLGSLIDESEKATATETATADEKLYRQNFLTAMSGDANTMRATAGVLRELGKTEYATRLEAAAEKEEAETGRKEKDRLLASYDNDILMRKEVPDLTTLRQQIVADTRILPGDRASRLANIDAKLASAEKTQAVKQAEIIMELPGFATNPKRQKEAADLLTRGLGFEISANEIAPVNKLSPNQMYNNKVSQLTTEISDPLLVHKAATDLVRLITKNPTWEYDPTKPETSLEDMPRPARIGIGDYIKNATSDIVSGKISAKDQLADLYQNVGNELVPTTSVADSIAREIRTRTSQAFLNSLGN